jgi:hypothetical protein
MSFLFGLLLGAIGAGAVAYSTGRNMGEKGWHDRITEVVRDVLLEWIAEPSIAPYVPSYGTAEYISGASADELFRLMADILRNMAAGGIIIDSPLEIALNLFYTKLVAGLGHAPARLRRRALARAKQKIAAEFPEVTIV